jgi:hypothetical protein
MLPRLGIAQVAWAPGASLCEANTGVNGGQQSSFDPANNRVRSRAEGGIAGTEHSSFAEVGVRFIPMASLTTKLKMEGIWPRGRLEGTATGPINWDLVGDSTDNPAVPSDINNLGITNCRASPNDTLEGFDDWANVKFNFRDSEFFAEGVPRPRS